MPASLAGPWRGGRPRGSTKRLDQITAIRWVSLHRLMLVANVSADQFADVLGVKRITVIYWLQGRANSSLMPLHHMVFWLAHKLLQITPPPACLEIGPIEKGGFDPTGLCGLPPEEIARVIAWELLRDLPGASDSPYVF